MKKKTGLGKGLSALLPGAISAPPPMDDIEKESGMPVRFPRVGGSIEDISVNEIHPNEFQPRKDFNEKLLAQLASSIKI